MVLVASGGPSYELSLVNLDSGNIEYFMTTNSTQSLEPSNLANQVVTMPSFLRDSSIRDGYSWPEKFESSESLF